MMIVSAIIVDMMRMVARLMAMVEMPFYKYCLK